MPKHTMSFSNLSVLTIACVTLAFVGCESQRYKPADWRGADNSTLTDRGDTAVVASNTNKKEMKRPDSPTNWMELSGTGGEAVGPRAANGTLPSRYGTLPARYGATSLPQRNGTSLPWRQGVRGTSLPNRQNRYDAATSGTTIPKRGSYRSGSTLPARN
ncbi:hypothetical protein OAG71_02150 [bacterium]|nr:hypothetical protein [bacterium]